VFFTAGCNEQVFSPKPSKKMAKIHAVVCDKNAKTAQLRRTPFRKNDITEPTATINTQQDQFQQPFASLMPYFYEQFY